MPESIKEKAKRLWAHEGANQKGIDDMIACAKSGCYECHRTLLANVRGLAENDRNRDVMWGEGKWSETDPRALAYRDQLAEYAAYRVAHPFPSPSRGRRRKHHVELYVMWLRGYFVQMLLPSMSLENAISKISEQECISESSARDAYRFSLIYDQYIMDSVKTEK